MRCNLVVSFVVAAAMSLSLLRAAAPQEEAILREILPSSSSNYYPNLMLRYMEGDSTLTAENYHHLYYGFAYDDAYKPLNTNPYMDKFLLLASSLDVEHPDPITLREIVMTGFDALKADPFSLKVWNMMAYAYGALGDSVNEQKAYRRVEMIIETIKATGDGLRERSPRHILMFDHALDLMAAENLPYTKARVISRTVEYVPFISPQYLADKKVKGLFYDFSRVYWNKPDSVTYQRDRTWQFNNLKPREYR